MDDNYTLKCICCGHEQTFINPQQAFDAGWDCPPYFSFGVFCDCCPSAPFVLGDKHWHDEVHERWKKDGRPAQS